MPANAGSAHLPNRFREKPEGIREFQRYVAVNNNWSYSLDAIAQLRNGLEQELPPGVKTIAIAGSFGRFEASQQSDADCIIVLDDDESLDIAGASNAVVDVITQTGN